MLGGNALLTNTKLMKSVALAISSSQITERLFVVVVNAVAWRNALFWAKSHSPMHLLPR